MYKQDIIQKFITNFILKDRRARVSFELTNPKKRHLFTNRLNHKWEEIFDMRFLYSFFGEKEYNIFEPLELCYIISYDDEIDDELITFDLAFEKIFGNGLGALIISLSAEKIYLETEQIQGAPERFLGFRKRN